MTYIEAWFGDLADQILFGINAQSQEPLIKYIQGAGTMEGLDVALIQIAYGLAPKALTTQSFIERTPYARADAYQEHFEGAAARGSAWWLLCHSPIDSQATTQLFVEPSLVSKLR